MEDKSNSPESSGNKIKHGLVQLARPFDYIIKDQKTASILLLACTVLALIIANSPLTDRYEELITTQMGLIAGDVRFTMSFHHWVNDALMALFFFVIGLEIKRELLVGELRNASRALPVIAAAIGGVMVPALIFYFINRGEDSLQGWAIPMATDTAFAIGVLALLGKRAPEGLTAFLLALAIIDDMAAVLVIAIFYTDTIEVQYLVIVFVMLAVLMTLNYLGIRKPVLYITGGVVTWYAMYNSGVHATLAGVLVAITIPARPARSPSRFIRQSRQLLDEFRRRTVVEDNDEPILAEPKQHELVARIQETAAEATTPLQLWERTLEHPVSLLVLPLFALVNAGIPLEFGTIPSLFQDPLALGIIFGLVAGKVIGISLATFTVLYLGWGKLTSGMNWTHVIGIGLLGGMGFTMSIFIASLGFDSSEEQLIVAKTAIILASLMAGILGYVWLYFSNRVNLNFSASEKTD